MITLPAGRVARNANDRVTISGSCENLATVVLEGSSTESVTCVGSLFSFTYESTADGVYSWSVRQQDLAGNISSAVTVQWTRDTSLPVAPTIDGGLATTYSSSSSVVVSGTCLDGFTVRLDGSVTSSDVLFPANSLVQECVSQAYSFVIGKVLDGIYDFAVSQTDPETLVPSASVMVSWGGTSSGSLVCPSEGSFSVTFASAVDGSFAWFFIQTDAAQNTSTSAGVSWVRDSSVPATPVILTPAASAIATSLDTQTISGTCAADHEVTLGGDLSSVEVLSPAGQLTQACVAGSFTYHVQKTQDGIYRFGVTQTNAAGTDSAQALVTWTRDTVAPAPVVLSSPVSETVISSGDLVVAGTCEPLARVLVTGGNEGAMTCAEGSFNMLVSVPADGSFLLTVAQSDEAGNLSTVVSFTWIRDSSLPAAPVIVSPSASPYISAVSTLSIHGLCTPYLSLSLAGVDASMVVSPSTGLTQTCPVTGSFTWGLVAPEDGSYAIEITQALDGRTSAPAAMEWRVDTLAPDIQLTAYPEVLSLSPQAQFAFASGDPQASFRCALDQGAQMACQSPWTITGLANGTHTFSVTASDAAGNVSAATSYVWQVNVRKTIALYHFDTDSGNLVDSSGHVAPYDSPLTQRGSVASTTGRFNQADVFTASAWESAEHNAATHQLALSTMTVEAFVKLSSFPTTYFTIAAKSGATSDLGWKFQIKRTGNSSRALAFNISTDGHTWGREVVSSKCTFSTSSWTHVAVTWNMGTVTFFCGGTFKSAKTIGTVGVTTIHPSTAPLWIGSFAGTQNALTAMDEFRWSQTVRYTQSFASPTTAFVGD
jgi:hypothetical protein